MRCAPLLLALALGLLPPAARADAPWAPAVSPPPAPRVAAPAPREPDLEARKRFEAAFAEGGRLLALGQYEAARPLLEAAVAAFPEHAEARLAHARALLMLGYLGWQRDLVVRARQDAAQALWQAPERPGARELLELADHLIGRMERLAAPPRPALNPAPARARP
jgi:tetratricopeptide (TPR) repeat protein